MAAEGQPPEPKRGVRGIDPLVNAIERLRPGQHIVVQKGTKSKASVSQKVNTARKSRGETAPALKVYESVHGDVIVACLGDAGDASKPRSAAQGLGPKERPFEA